MEAGKKVLVTTSYRGVFFGELVKQDEHLTTLKDARMCVSWSRAVRGVVGLAATGPDAKCRITRAAPVAELVGVTAILECSEEAVGKWETAPWS